MRRLIIYGAGGHAREVSRLIRQLNADCPRWELIGYVSDDRAGGQIDGVPVLDPTEALDRAGPACDAVIAVGNPAKRRRIAATFESAEVDFPTLIHPSVSLDASVSVGRGSTVCEGSILTVDIKIGEFVLINRACNVSHDCRIGDFSSLAPGTLLSGNVTIGAGCDIGTGVSVIPGVEIGDGAVVGAGAAVTGSLPPNCTAVGVPARVIRSGVDA